MRYRTTYICLGGALIILLGLGGWIGPHLMRDQEANRAQPLADTPAVSPSEIATAGPSRTAIFDAPAEAPQRMPWVGNWASTTYTHGQVVVTLYAIHPNGTWTMRIEMSDGRQTASLPPLAGGRWAVQDSLLAFYDGTNGQLRWTGLMRDAQTLLTQASPQHPILTFTRRN